MVAYRDSERRYQNYLLYAHLFSEVNSPHDWQVEVNQSNAG